MDVTYTQRQRRGTSPQQEMEPVELPPAPHNKRPHSTPHTTKKGSSVSSDEENNHILFKNKIDEKEVEKETG